MYKTWNVITTKLNNTVSKQQNNYEGLAFKFYPYDNENIK